MGKKDDVQLSKSTLIVMFLVAVIANMMMVVGYANIEVRMKKLQAKNIKLEQELIELRKKECLLYGI